MYKGFDETGFMAWLEDNFTGFENSYLRSLVENVIDYAHAHEHVGKDQLAYFVSDMLPEVTFGEVAMFCEDDILTASGQRMKREALSENAAA